ncbi:hypothetical protein [Caballeronia telluris]|uniref:Uncharacterized protein n=1 Tax=Caballeronia telluris TaxID=326475 RepID=A0A158IVT5_9BURK|nr:hypothetical protein [Caballeronia telluris]SAL60161.1 hypothetical protein AWB66_03416 [Caballeronia telluris]
MLREHGADISYAVRYGLAAHHIVYYITNFLCPPVSRDAFAPPALPLHFGLQSMPGACMRRVFLI